MRQTGWKGIAGHKFYMSHFGINLKIQILKMVLLSLINDLYLKQVTGKYDFNKKFTPYALNPS